MSLLVERRACGTATDIHRRTRGGRDMSRGYRGGRHRRRGASGAMFGGGAVLYEGGAQEDGSRGAFKHAHTRHVIIRQTLKRVRSTIVPSH